MMRVVLLAVCSANVVALLEGPANQADDATGAEGHADERPPSNDAPTSRSLMFATLPQKMTYSSNTYSSIDTCGGQATTALLAARFAGDSDKFYYDSPLWTNLNDLGVASGTADFKSASVFDTPAEAVIVEMTSPSGVCRSTVFQLSDGLVGAAGSSCSDSWNIWCNDIVFRQLSDRRSLQ